MLYRYFIKVSFDGARYNGWQVQENASQTVQQKINEGLSKLLNEEIEVQGCCRTDAGVHAKELFAHFDSQKKNLHNDVHTDWIYRFNKMIPADIAINKIFSVKDDANARYDATSRMYQYFIHPERNPFLVGRSYFYYSELDIPLMNRASKLLLKQTDFTSFSKLNIQAKTKICKIKKAEWKKDKEGNLIFTIKADRFLRGMVRMIVGTMILLGKNKISLDDFREILESKDCRNAAALAPAGGLYLAKVEFPKRIFLK